MNHSIAALLADLRMDFMSSPYGWQHLDGSPVTEGEMAIIQRATGGDLQGAFTIAALRRRAEAGDD